MAAQNSCQQFATYPSLKDRVVVVTGGASGIGGTIVEQFARQGSRVAFLDVAAEAGRQLVDKLAPLSEHAPAFFQCDLTQISALRETFAEIQSRIGMVNVLVNNAANDMRHAYADVTAESWDAAMAVNLRHQFFAIQAVARGMIANGGGSIINMSSICWMIPSTGMPAYVTAKAAIIGLTRTTLLKNSHKTSHGRAARFYKVFTYCVPVATSNAPTVENMSLMYRTVVLVLISVAGATASAPVVLQDFGIGNLDGGNWLYAGLVMDSAGNLYGGAYYGGLYNHGVVYKLSPTGSGGWQETVLYDFKGTTREQDGAGPYSAPTFDGAGNLYGTTTYGGVSNKTCGNTGCGVVYKLTPSGSTWEEAVLYRFTGTPDGFRPYAGLDIDAAGNLYGVTSGGGSDNLGTVFELSPNASGGWTETVIHSFKGADGSNPQGMPVLDAAGNLWGTTYAGGAHNKGVVYELSPQASGGWNIHVLYSFKGGTDGANPFAGVTMGPDGSLFGTTSVGGTALCGVAYGLARNASGGWTETILHTFLGVGAGDAANPNGLTFDAHGNLFGTSLAGGTDNPGTIFEISPAGRGAWQERVLYSFTGGLDGANPTSSLIIDQLGNLYGTTLYGGPAGSIDVGGVVFEFTP